MLILDKSILNYKHESVRQGINYDSEEISKSINGLLLSANELTISEKTAFINLYLKKLVNCPIKLIYRILVNDVVRFIQIFLTERKKVWDCLANNRMIFLSDQYQNKFL